MMRINEFKKIICLLIGYVEVAGASYCSFLHCKSQRYQGETGKVTGESDKSYCYLDEQSYALEANTGAISNLIRKDVSKKSDARVTNRACLGESSASVISNAAILSTSSASPGTSSESFGTNAATSGTSSETADTNTASHGTSSATPGTNSATPGTNTASHGTNSSSPGTNSASHGTSSATPGTSSASVFIPFYPRRVNNQGSSKKHKTIMKIKRIKGEQI